MPIVKHIIVWSAFISLALLNACSEPRNFDDEIRAADSLKTRMDQTLAVIDSTTLLISDSITNQLNYIQSNYRGEMERAMALSLLRYGDMRKNITLLYQWKDSLRDRQDEIENEIISFRNTLADKATHDRLDREINEMYADTAIHNLIQKQQQWHAKINEWLQQQKSIYNNWNTLNDTILNWRQSIPNQIQPQ